MLHNYITTHSVKKKKRKKGLFECCENVCGVNS